MSSDDRIGELLKLAGRREMPDTQQMLRAKAAARAEWMQVAGHRRRPFLRWAFSGAAILAIALLAAARFRTVEAPARVAAPADVATLQTVMGSVLVTRDGVAPRVVDRPGLRLAAGDRVETPSGSRAAFSLAGGTAVKLDDKSIVLLEAGEGVTLERGALFADAGSDARDGGFHVRTPLGVVRHLGTQFEVRLQDAGLRIRVREGRVAVETADGRWISREGEALRVLRGGRPERQAILTFGAEWDWVNALAPPFVLEGSTLGAFLEWGRHHHGLRWRFADGGLRDRAEPIVLHGSIDGLAAEEALEAVLRTCGLTLRREGDLLIIAKP